MTSSEPSDRRCLVVRALWLGALALGVWLGALGLAFLCDDAFITFRYVSNARDGHGLVWNPPPFLPVEGYTGFLWAVLLWGTWSWLGVEPPDAANSLSIACGLATFAVVAAAAFRIRGRDGRRPCDLVVLAALAAIAGNRTFLQWLTSGLETALFELAAVGWVVVAFRTRARRTTGWLATWSACGAAAALTRPDGLLFVGATAAAVGLDVLRGRTGLRSALLGSAPLLLVAAHVTWRVSFYGEWLPNTYYAKVGEPWPEAGLRYLLLFVVENGAWIWIGLAAVWAFVECRRGAAAVAGALLDHVPAAAAVAATVAGAGYYVLVVGGDHFEFRVFAHLVPLAGLAALAMVVRLSRGTALPVAVLLAIGIGSGVAWVVPALQPTTTLLYEPLAPHVPGFVQPAARWYDRHRAWLSMQAVGVRCDAHRAFLANEVAVLPERARTPRPPGDVPVIDRDCVGWLGWVMPDVAIVDRLGLNDWVAARWTVPRAAGDAQSPVERVLAVADADGDARITPGEVTAAARAAGFDPGATEAVARQLFLIFGHGPDALPVAALPRVRAFFANLRPMAHERHAPPDYLAAFAPNVSIDERRLVVAPRGKPLDEARISAIEAEWRGRIRGKR